MTAKSAGKLALDGAWLSLKVLRDQWFLLAFFATALFWARDVYEDFVTLPPEVADLRQTVDALRDDIARLDAKMAAASIDRSPALAFPGRGHVVADGVPGQRVEVRLAPVIPLRPECGTGALAAYMIDAAGMWFTVDSGLVDLPHLDGPQDLAFWAAIHPEMAPGRALFLAQVTYDCGGHRQVDSSPRLHFRVLDKASETSH